MSETLLAAPDPGDRAATTGDWMLLAAVLAITGAVVWLVAGEPLVVAGFVGGVLAIASAARVLLRQRSAAAPVEFAQPDWSVTQAAIERPDAALAVTDRAGRLVCANTRFEQWFGIGAAPRPNHASNRALAQTSRPARSVTATAASLRSIAAWVTDQSGWASSAGAEAARGRRRIRPSAAKASTPPA